jgi:hypothetical protein
MMDKLDSSEDWRRHPAVIQAAWDRVDPSVRDAILDWIVRRGRGDSQKICRAQGPCPPTCCFLTVNNPAPKIRSCVYTARARTFASGRLL